MNVISFVCYSYIRFSTPAQREGDSLRRQTMLRDAWINRNGGILDTTLSMMDDGVSGFTGQHRTNEDRHGLACFLEAVRNGAVQAGSVLIVENLDRLTREDTVPAVNLFTGILVAGVRIVQLLPTEIVYTDRSDMMDIMRAILELSRGHSESRMKSERIGEAWEEKRRLATEQKKILTSRLPGWLCQNGDRIEPIPERVEVVRRIFRLAQEGNGCQLIATVLNKERVPTFNKSKSGTRGQSWSVSTIYAILTSRSVLGECQPHTGQMQECKRTDPGKTRRREGRIPVGEPIPGYFPTIIEPEEYHATLAAIKGRRLKGGREGCHVNIFKGLLRDARDGGTIILEHAKRRPSSLYLLNAKRGLIPGVSFPLAIFERAIVTSLAELDPSTLLTGPVLNLADSIVGELVVVKARLANLKRLLLEEDEATDIVEAVRELSQRKNALQERLSEEQRKSAASTPGAWGAIKPLVAQMDAENWSQEAKMRLRNAIGRVVSEMKCLFIGSGKNRPKVALVRMTFKDSPAVRSFWIDYVSGRYRGEEDRWDCRAIRHEEAFVNDIDTPSGVSLAEQLVLAILKCE